MTSQWEGELETAGARRETARACPARIAAAIVVLASLTVVNATPRIRGVSTTAPAPSRIEQPMPSACGSEAVARAQRELNRTPQPGAIALS